MRRQRISLQTQTLFLGNVIIAACLVCGCESARPTTGALWLGTTGLSDVDNENWDRKAPSAHPAQHPSNSEPDDRSNGAEKTETRPREKPWHLDLAQRGSYTKLASTKQQLDRRLDLPLQTDFLHVFDEPYTPVDRKSDLGFTTWYVGLGRQECEYLVWTCHLGGGLGQDLDHQRFLNSTLEVDFRYAYLYAGVTAELYPWRVPRPMSPMTWSQRLSASRPFLLTGFETGYLSAEGEGEYKFAGIPAYHDDQKVRDWLASVLVGAGWSLPLTDRWSIKITGDYTFHFYRSEEYNGWNWVTALRYTF